ncbi:MAG: hypothetical protein HY017_14450 [Betaproteobacteria bacterium]|nr:hypothetical protein [Betaproteobacteria bacterium]
MTPRNKHPMRRSLDTTALRRMAGARSYARGEEYYAQGRVRSLAGHDGTITAKVRCRYE